MRTLNTENALEGILYTSDRLRPNRASYGQAPQHDRRAIRTDDAVPLDLKARQRVRGWLHLEILNGYSVLGQLPRKTFPRGTNRC